MPSALDAPIHRLLLEHVVDGEMLAGVAQKRHEIDGSEPIGVVDDPRGIGRRAEIEEPLELNLDAGDVCVDLIR